MHYSQHSLQVEYLVEKDVTFMSSIGTIYYAASNAGRRTADGEGLYRDKRSLHHIRRRVVAMIMATNARMMLVATQLLPVGQVRTRFLLPVLYVEYSENGLLKHHKQNRSPNAIPL